jgi:hypothetical protein
MDHGSVVIDLDASEYLPVGEFVVNGEVPRDCRQERGHGKRMLFSTDRFLICVCVYA